MKPKSVARSHLEPLIEKQQNNNLKTDDAINLLALENNIAIHENELAVLRSRARISERCWQ